MRFQWNRLGRTDYSEVLDQQRSGYIDKRHSGYICPCCGLELYSEWAFHLQGFGEPIGQDFDKMQDEAVAFAQLKECPCCGGILIHDQKFFIQVESPGFCNVLFFKNCVCLYFDEMFGFDQKVNTVDNMYKYLYAQQQGLDSKYAEERMASISTQYDTPGSVNVNIEAICSINSDSAKLQEYLLKIINIERNIRSLKARLLVLYKLNYKTNKEAILAQCYPIMLEKTSHQRAIAAKVEQMQKDLQSRFDEISVLQQQREHLASAEIITPAVCFPNKPIEPVKPIYATPSLFNKKKITTENEAKAEKYNNEVMRYNSALTEYHLLVEAAERQRNHLRNEAIEKRKKELLVIDEQIVKKKLSCDELLSNIDAQKVALESEETHVQRNNGSPASQLKISLEEEISTAEALLADLFRQKNQLYETDIVFRKYRDFAAITSFYEYLLSGRCETLTGMNGCYNLYEAELRANIIINKLDEITQSLEKIKKNQYMLYSQLSAIDAELQTLNATTNAVLRCVRDSTEVLLEHTAVIAHNSATIARDSHITAHNSATIARDSSVIAHNSAVTAYNSAVTSYYAKLNAEIASSARYIHMICW